VLVLHGGGANDERGYASRYACLLAHHGYAVLDLAYFDTPETPPDLVEIPIEYFSRAIDWLLEQDEVTADRVGTVAWSRGTEAQFLLAARDDRVYVFPGCPETSRATDRFPPGRVTAIRSRSSNRTRASKTTWTNPHLSAFTELSNVHRLICSNAQLCPSKRFRGRSYSCPARKTPSGRRHSSQERLSVDSRSTSIGGRTNISSIRRQAMALQVRTTLRVRDWSINWAARAPGTPTPRPTPGFTRLHVFNVDSTANAAEFGYAIEDHSGPA